MLSKEALEYMKALGVPEAEDPGVVEYYPEGDGWWESLACGEYRCYVKKPQASQNWRAREGLLGRRGFAKGDGEVIPHKVKKEIGDFIQGSPGYLYLRAPNGSLLEIGAYEDNKEGLAAFLQSVFDEVNGEA